MYICDLWPLGYMISPPHRTFAHFPTITSHTASHRDYLCNDHVCTIRGPTPNASLGLLKRRSASTVVGVIPSQLESGALLPWITPRRKRVGVPTQRHRHHICVITSRDDRGDILPNKRLKETRGSDQTLTSFTQPSVFSSCPQTLLSTALTKHLHCVPIAHTHHLQVLIQRDKPEERRPSRS